MTRTADVEQFCYILDNKEQSQKIYEKLYEQKVVESVSAKVKVTEKAVSAEEFAELAKTL